MKRFTAFWKGVFMAIATKKLLADGLKELLEKKTLDKIKGKQLRKFQKEVLSSNNIFFYISGNYPETAVVTVTKLMENYPLTVMKKERKNLAPVPKRFFARKPKVYVKNSKKTCVCFSVDIDASNYTISREKSAV